MKHNIILDSDSYKVNHFNVLRPGTEVIYSYFEARKGAEYDDAVFFGLQPLLDRLQGVVITQDLIDQTAIKIKAHFFGNDTFFNREGWEYIANELGGKLPIRIKAVPEGTVVPINNVMMTVENTDEKCAWLTNYLETYLSRIWYPITVATKSYQTKKILKRYLDDTADADFLLPFMLHDFGSRGVNTFEGAGLGGAAHLVNFVGTDTMAALDYAVEYYDADINTLGYSVFATEHSVMTAGGPEGEMDIVQDCFDKNPVGIISLVADSYDYYNFVKQIGGRFKEQTIARNANAGDIPTKVVIRPDSITPDHQTPEELVVWTYQQLEKDFGVTMNTKGYKELHPAVGVIWGDGIDTKGIERILEALKQAGYSTGTQIFGMGGCLLQRLNRDTMRHAFKCSAQKRNGEWIDIQKNPLDQSKKSKAGRLGLYLGKDGVANTYRIDDLKHAAHGPVDHLVTVFENGEIKVKYTFDEIRENAKL